MTQFHGLARLKLVAGTMRTTVYLWPLYPVLGPRNTVKYKQMETPIFSGSYILVKVGEMKKSPLDCGGLRKIGLLALCRL